MLRYNSVQHPLYRTIQQTHCIDIEIRLTTILKFYALFVFSRFGISCFIISHPQGIFKLDKFIHLTNECMRRTWNLCFKLNLTGNLMLIPLLNAEALISVIPLLKSHK